MNTTYLKFKTLLPALLSVLSISLLPAQEIHHVDIKSFTVSLYNGYVNEMNILVINLKDTVNRRGYKLHALAQGAEIDYEQTEDYPAAKFFVLPNQPSGYIHFYMEKNGVYFHVNDSIYFRAFKANPDDEMFKRSMGITKNNPGTKLKSVKHFVLPKRSKVARSDFELDGFDFYNTFLERNNSVKIKVRPMVTKVIAGEKYYAPQFVNVGKYEIRSSDLEVKEVARNTFYVSPTTQKPGGRFELYLNNKKVRDGSFSIKE